MSVALADGQLTAVSSAIFTGLQSTGRLSLTLHNTSGTLTETVTITQQRNVSGALNPTRRRVRCVLAPNEFCLVQGIAVDIGDVLAGLSSDANVVDYFLDEEGSIATQFSITVFDANGAPKTNPNLTTGAVIPPSINFKNMLDGGDFTVNPWQRNVPGLRGSAGVSASISNTVTYFPDRWFGVGGASSAFTLSQVADTSIAGFSQNCKIQRTAANANTAVINFGQVLETNDSIRAQGQSVTLSFWAKAGANFSAASSLITVQLFSGTGTDQSAANMIAGSWTGSTTPVSTTQALTTSMVRYSFTGTVPTGCTQLGVLLSFTPVGTAGADDSFSVQGLQLELGGQASNFEHRDIQVELEICQRYAWVIAEPATGVVVGMGVCPTATTATIYMAAPVQLRAAPTVTVSAGSFTFRPANAAASGTPAAGTTHTPNAITVVGTALTSTTAGFGTPLLGGSGTGYIVASADY